MIVLIILEIANVQHYLYYYFKYNLTCLHTYPTGWALLPPPKMGHLRHNRLSHLPRPTSPAARPPASTTDTISHHTHLKPSHAYTNTLQCNAVLKKWSSTESGEIKGTLV